MSNEKEPFCCGLAGIHLKATTVCVERELTGPRRGVLFRVPGLMMLRPNEMAVKPGIL